MKGHAFKHDDGRRSFWHPLRHNHSWYTGVLHHKTGMWSLEGKHEAELSITRNDAIIILKHGVKHWIMEQMNVAG